MGIFAYPHTPCAYFRLQRLRSTDFKKIGLTHGLLLDFLPPTLNFFIVSVRLRLTVRSVQSARSTANRLADLASINLSCHALSLRVSVILGQGTYSTFDRLLSPFGRKLTLVKG